MLAFFDPNNRPMKQKSFIESLDAKTFAEAKPLMKKYMLQTILFYLKWYGMFYLFLFLFLISAVIITQKPSDIPLILATFLFIAIMFLIAFPLTYFLSLHDLEFQFLREQNDKANKATSK
jgi:prolipoprotein diacylglyceryltransferase